MSQEETSSLAIFTRKLMGVSQPYRRTYRPMLSGGNYGDYFLHPKYAQSPKHFSRAFLLLQKDLLQVFDYIEPADINHVCYSFRIHELLFRACVEIEANLRAILKENDYKYKEPKHWNINDYREINWSHRLSSFSVRLPVWHGTGDLRIPFEAWSKPFLSGAEDVALPWYTAYNSTKHDRYGAFKQATFKNMIDAICGLVVLLASQFGQEDYLVHEELRIIGGPDDGMEQAIGDYFRVKYPDDWPLDQLYDFNWKELSKLDDPFQGFPFSKPCLKRAK